MKMRVNTFTPLHITPSQGSLASAQMRKDNPYVERKKQLGEAAPRTASFTKGGTYDGKELRPFEGRPGSMDAYKLPSRGF